MEDIHEVFLQTEVSSVKVSKAFTLHFCHFLLFL
jgi:hypothetical protein